MARTGRRRVVVSGPPGSGKSTWVRARARRGDLVWDLDAVASVIGGPPLSDARRSRLSPLVLRAALAMREALLGVVEAARDLGDAYAFVIVSDHDDAARCAARLKADLVAIDPYHQVDEGVR